MCAIGRKSLPAPWLQLQLGVHNTEHNCALAAFKTQSVSTLGNVYMLQLSPYSARPKKSHQCYSLPSFNIVISVET